MENDIPARADDGVGDDVIDSKGKNMVLYASKTPHAQHWRRVLPRLSLSSILSHKSISGHYNRCTKHIIIIAYRPLLYYYIHSMFFFSSLFSWHFKHAKGDTNMHVLCVCIIYHVRIMPICNVHSTYTMIWYGNSVWKHFGVDRLLVGCGFQAAGAKLYRWIGALFHRNGSARHTAKHHALDPVYIM